MIKPTYNLKNRMVHSSPPSLQPWNRQSMNYQEEDDDDDEAINNEENGDNEEDDFDYDEQIFTDNNPEFMNFKKEVSDWITLDDDIRTLQKAIKERKDKKTELTPKILYFMEKFKINDLNTNDGKLKFSRSLYTKPLNKKYLISRLGDFFRDYSKGEKIAGFIMDNRDKEEKVRLTRTLDRSKK